jgi:hypothetical protein
MNRKLILPLLVLLPFTAFSVWVSATQGYTGFLSLAGREPWALQMLLDLSISLFLFASWMRRDARERGLPFAPYVVLCVLLGSIGALAYLVHRALRAREAPGLRGASV